MAVGADPCERCGDREADDEAECGFAQWGAGLDDRVDPWCDDELDAVAGEGPAGLEVGGLDLELTDRVGGGGGDGVRRLSRLDFAADLSGALGERRDRCVGEFVDLECRLGAVRVDDRLRQRDCALGVVGVDQDGEHVRVRRGGGDDVLAEGGEVVSSEVGGDGADHCVAGDESGALGGVPRQRGVALDAVVEHVVGAGC